MGAIPDLVAALAVLGLMRANDARKAERICKQEEAFVLFKLPPLPQEEHRLTEEQRTPVSMHNKRIGETQREYLQEKAA